VGAERVVVADTSVWIPFFNDPHSEEKRELDALIDLDRLVLVGVVLAELIQGCRTAGEAEATTSSLEGLRFIETTLSTWRRVGEVSFSLRRKAITVPLSDLVVAALALEHRLEIYTLDPHFKQIPGLTLYVPAGARRGR
jgi:predicted nucleic acid-binding protein